MKIEMDLDLALEIGEQLAGKERLIYQISDGYSMTHEEAQISGSTVNRVRKYLAKSVRYEIECSDQLNDAEKRELCARFTW